MLIPKSKQNHLWAFFQENLKNSKISRNKTSELINKKQKGMDDIFLNENSPNNRTKIVVSNFNTTSFLNNAQNLLKDQGETNNKFQDYL